MPHKFVPRKGQVPKDPPAHEPPPPPPDPELDELPPPPPVDETADEPTPKVRLGKDRPAKERQPKPSPLKEARRRSLLGIDPQGSQLLQRPRPKQQSSQMVSFLAVVAFAVVVFVGVVFVVMKMLPPSIPGYESSVKVSAPTRLDWIFAEEKKSLSEPKTVWKYFESTNQRFELYVPPDYDASKAYPVVLFISSEKSPAGWRTWQKVCQEHGIIFAGPYAAGSDRLSWERIRIAMDVLDEVRRKYHTDPDQTYIVGQGSGGRIASKIGFALPEFFGGVVALGEGDLIREEYWLRERVIDRLSVALLVGDKDPTRVEMDKIIVPVLDGLGVRFRLWVSQEGRTGDMPTPEQVEEIYEWLEQGLPQRRLAAEKHPGSRIAGDAAPTREEWSQALFDEASKRIDSSDPKEQLAGEMQLRGCFERWEGVPAALKAYQLFSKYYNQPPEKKTEEAALCLRQDLPVARGLTAYLTGNIDPVQQSLKYERNKEWKTQAITLWQKVYQAAVNAKDTSKAQEAAQKSKELQK